MLRQDDNTLSAHAEKHRALWLSSLLKEFKELNERQCRLVDSCRELVIFLRNHDTDSASYTPLCEAIDSDLQNVMSFCKDKFADKESYYQELSDQALSVANLNCSPPPDKSTVRDCLKKLAYVVMNHPARPNDSDLKLERPTSLTEEQSALKESTQNDSDGEGFSALPLEIKSRITNYLPTRDVLNLGQTNKRLQHEIKGIRRYALFDFIRKYGLSDIRKVNASTCKFFSVPGAAEDTFIYSATGQDCVAVLNEIYDQFIKPAYDKYGCSRDNKFCLNPNFSLVFWALTCQKDIDAIWLAALLYRQEERSILLNEEIFKMAVGVKRFDIVEKLITEHGVLDLDLDLDVDVDVKGRTALHIACEEVNLNAIRMLIKYGADVDKTVNAPFYYLNSHYHYTHGYFTSSRLAQLSPLYLLILAPNRRYSTKETIQDSIEAISLLLDSGASVTEHGNCYFSVDNRSYSYGDRMIRHPIHCAIRTRNIEAAELLWKRKPIIDEELIYFLFLSSRENYSSFLSCDNDNFFLRFIRMVIRMDDTTELLLSAIKFEYGRVVAEALVSQGASLPSEMNSAIFTDQSSREVLEDSIRGLNHFIKRNASTLDPRQLMSSLKLLVDTQKLIEQLNSQIDMAEKTRYVNAYQEKYAPTPFARIVGTVVVAAIVAISGAIVGALIAGAAMSWSGPGAIVAAFIGLFKGAAFGWAHGAVIGASITGAAIGPLGVYGGCKIYGFFFEKKSSVAQRAHVLSVAEKMREGIEKGSCATI